MIKNSGSIQQNERILSLDVIRGFALLGILIANSIVFQFGMLGSITTVQGMYQNGALDEWTHFFIRLLVDGSFITLFSFLFGYGTALQRSRFLAKQASFTPVFWRRTGLLLIFGFLHIIFLWRGDILLTYSLTAMLLLAFLPLKKRGLFISAVIWFTLMASSALLPDMGATPAPAYYENEQAIIANGTYADHVQFRGSTDMIGLTSGGSPIAFLFGEIFFQLSAVLTVMPMFLFGAFVAKSKWLETFHLYRKKAFLFLPVFLLVGLTAKLPNALAGGANTQYELLSVYVGAPFLALFYGTSVALIVSYRAKWMTPFATVGKMAFTNYILQSVIFTFLFYGYGLGLYGQLGIFYGVLLCFVVYVLQVIFSIVWLKFFRIGPLEYIWRSGTYLRMQTLTRTKRDTD
ncbi:DUF418 domain-containing protein [Shouchella sp. JSM 1781072]|uniref:DUF418 domain-containing protein n=1 Tax=Shouchella sp. JSM 1781072 TaxID=3344581 RepID=UPI0035BEC767